MAHSSNLVVYLCISALLRCGVDPQDMLWVPAAWAARFGNTVGETRTCPVRRLPHTGDGKGHDMAIFDARRAGAAPAHGSAGPPTP